MLVISDALIGTYSGLYWFNKSYNEIHSKISMTFLKQAWLIRYPGHMDVALKFSLEIQGVLCGEMS